MTMKKMMTMAPRTRSQPKSESRPMTTKTRRRPRTCCNGADVLEFAKLKPKMFRTLVNEVHSSFRLLESLRIPTIASVQGMAVGGGFELALACDFLVVEASATLLAIDRPVLMRRSKA